MGVDGVGCKNPAPAGPFGGCAAVQMGSGNSTAASRRRFKRRAILD